MTLDDYLSRPGAETMVELARRLCLNVDQIRQWRHKHAARKPSPENCVLLEQQTGGIVRRWDLRADDWHLIWPELIGTKGAPKVKTEKAGVA